MNVTITRQYHPDVTLGLLQIEGVKHVPIYTLELPWKDNEQNVSCVPAGTYEVVPFNWENDKKFKHKSVYRLQDVPNRTAIDVHSGNTVKDILGCILVGLSKGDIDGLPAVLQSASALFTLRNLIGRKPFTLTIKEQ